MKGRCAGGGARVTGERLVRRWGSFREGRLPIGGGWHVGWGWVVRWENDFPSWGLTEREI